MSFILILTLQGTKKEGWQKKKEKPHWRLYKGEINPYFVIIIVNLFIDIIYSALIAIIHQLSHKCDKKCIKNIKIVPKLAISKLNNQIMINKNIKK